MSEPIFLDIEKVMDILMAEIPDGVYASDRADDPDPNKRSYSSSELRAHATLLANLYANLNGIWDDKFLTTVTAAGLTPWEKQLFATLQDSGQSFQTRKNNLLAKFRATGGISYPAIESLIQSILDPVSLTFDLVTWGCGSGGGGAWILDFTPLDVETYLASRAPLTGARQDLTPLDCDLDYAAAGLTAQDLIDIQSTAYTYEVRIHGNADAATLNTLDIALTEAEPSRSTHVITNNYPDPIAP